MQVRNHRPGPALVLIACLGAAFAAPPVEAATTWTARIGTIYGEAKITTGTTTRLSIAAKSFRARIAYTISLRRGSCSAPGSLILSRRLTTSTYGKITATVSLTSSQARLLKLPMSIRIGTKCGSFKALPEPGTIVDGTWRIGTSVKPGMYRTVGGTACRWARLSGLGGTSGEIIGDNYSSHRYPSGPQVVSIAATDVGFTASGCGTWRLQSQPPAGAPAVDLADGTWRVGVDIQPGTYRTPGAAAPWPPFTWDSWLKACHWARLSGFGGTDGEVIAATSVSLGPQVVTVGATDAGFASNGCGTWTLQPVPPVGIPTATPSDGIWRVGVDIQPGPYQAIGAGGLPRCQWARLAGFGGTPSEVIADNSATPPTPRTLGPEVVTIAPTDAGFRSLGCGTWTSTSSVNN